jgi:hypothetical protein
MLVGSLCDPSHTWWMLGYERAKVFSFLVIERLDGLDLLSNTLAKVITLRGKTAFRMTFFGTRATILRGCRPCSVPNGCDYTRGA